MRIIPFAPLAFAAAVATSVASPDSAGAQTDSELQVWTAVLTTAELSDDAPRFSMWLDNHMRRGSGATTFIVRPGFGVHLTSWLSAWAGYGWIPIEFDGDGGTLHEHRVWQQFILSGRLGPASVQARSRFEQRFVEGGDDVGLRFREFVRIGWQPPEAPVGMVLWDELFLGINEPDFGAPQGLDQNRLFVGLFLPIRPGIRLEMGYLWLYLDRATNLHGHVFATNLFASLGG